MFNTSLLRQDSVLRLSAATNHKYVGKFRAGRKPVSRFMSQRAGRVIKQVRPSVSGGVTQWLNRGPGRFLLCHCKGLCQNDTETNTVTQRWTQMHAMCACTLGRNLASKMNPCFRCTGRRGSVVSSSDENERERFGN